MVNHHHYGVRYAPAYTRLTILHFLNWLDDNLFAKIQFNPHHVLYKLLPEKNTISDHGVILSH